MNFHRDSGAIAQAQGCAREASESLPLSFAAQAVSLYRDSDSVLPRTVLLTCTAYVQNYISKLPVELLRNIMSLAADRPPNLCPEIEEFGDFGPYAPNLKHYHTAYQESLVSDSSSRSRAYPHP